MSFWEKIGIKTEAGVLDKEIRKTIDEIAVLGLQRQGTQGKTEQLNGMPTETNEEIEQIDRKVEELRRKLQSLEEKRGV